VQRVKFRERAAHWMVSKLKFLDETGSQLNMTRLYGRAIPGERVVEAIPSDYGSNYTLIAALSLEGLQAPWAAAGLVDISLS